MKVEVRMVMRTPPNAGPMNREARKAMMKSIQGQNPAIEQVKVREVEDDFKLEEF